MFLKTSLTNALLEGKPISDYVNRIKSLADELGLIDGSVKSDDLTLYILNGLTPEYRDIVSEVRTRDTPFRFEELRDRLIEHELYLKQIESKTASLVATANVAQTGSSSSQHSGHKYSSGGRGRSDSHRGNSNGCRGNHFSHGRGSNQNNQWRGARDYSVVCQLCGFKGHTAPFCRRLQASVNFAQSPTHGSQPSWLMDSGASHNLTSDLGNLLIHSEYDGTDEIQIADGLGLSISHTCSTHIHTPSRKYLLSDVLCVPGAAKNLISVHQFTKVNCVSLEFFPDCFLIKDHTTGAVLARGPCSNGVYQFQPQITSSITKVASLGVRTTASHWHSRLGHPSGRTSSFILSAYNLPVLQTSAHVPDTCFFL
ncbi:hypothetical protein PHJA_001557200 [Phtheirospermum japonicum]|uniref:Retrovirus-related Pol polyprotein from transposon TNT 1-94-like beta-barrel domain-containing protein n=1 Tax=Phtheirospermum japonicum TaxID=374723 RepID=A0A830CAR3_9LAMI|nr:hypothetical protein PHJA_001557200 [Phtheirospermum japonicum]